MSKQEKKAKHNPKVSVIIPCYNVEKYIAKCLDSVCGQTLKDLEIICIDDCSKDNTVKIIQKYKKKDNRIILVKHSTNCGVSVSRNDGIKKATGEYIGFVDSDDYIDSEFFNKLYKIAKQEKADIAKGKLVFVQNGKEIPDYTNGNMIKKNKFNLYYSFTSCIYAKSLLVKNKILFPIDLIYGEDSYFIMQAVAFCKNIATLDNVNYYYFQRADSADSEILSDTHFAAGIEFIKRSINFLNKCDCSPEEYVQAVRYKFGTLFGYMAKTEQQSQQHLIVDVACDLWQFVKHKELFVKNQIIEYLDKHDKENLFLYTSGHASIEKVFPGVTKKVTIDDIKYYLFGIVSVLKIRKKYNIQEPQKCFRLFNIIPIWTVKNKNGYRFFYILGFIPISRIKNK